MKTIKTDVCVVGAGAGGFGCVYRLLKNGINTVVVEKNKDFGGTAVFCGVDGWEPGVSLDGAHLLLKEELQKMNQGAVVLEAAPNCNLFFPENGMNWENHSFEQYPWGLSMPSNLHYSDTLKRCRSLRKDGSMKRFQFEGAAMTKAMHQVLAPYQNKLSALFGYEFYACEKSGRNIRSVTVKNGGESIRIVADFYIDATGDIILSREAGCAVAMGSESKYRYQEPSAGEKDSRQMNAVTYVFRVSPAANLNHIDEMPERYQKVDISAWKASKMKRTVSCFCLYPNHDINVNMLPTMEGAEYIDFGEAADEVGKARVYSYWKYLQTEKNMNGYSLTKIFSAGVRESYRLIGKYVLNENDVRAGLFSQPKRGRTVAIADHALDVHGTSGMCRELEYPYEIPLECTMPREVDNLFVASRGASFSHIAAASARLTRTILSLGEGVGEYVAEQINSGLYFKNV